MDIRKEIQDELQELAPNLAKIEKRYPFKVEEKYFDTLWRKISDAVDLKENNKQSWNWDWLWRWLLEPQYAVSFAVVIVLIIFSVNYFSPEEKQMPRLRLASSGEALDNLNSEEITNYIHEHLNDFKDEIIEQYCCVDINSADYLFQNQQEQENYIENYLTNQIKEEDIL